MSIRKRQVIYSSKGDQPVDIKSVGDCGKLEIDQHMEKYLETLFLDTAAQIKNVWSLNAAHW